MAIHLNVNVGTAVKKGTLNGYSFFRIALRGVLRPEL